MSIKKEKTESVGVKPYRLYVGKVGTPIPDGVKYSFIPSTLKYLLIFSDREPPKNFTLADEEGKMPLEVKQWLLLVKARVNAEYIKSRQAEVNECLNSFLDNFEKELEKEQENVRNGKENSDGEVAGESANSGNGVIAH